MTAKRLTENPNTLSGMQGIVFDKDGTLVNLDGRWAPFFNGLVDATTDDAALREVLRAVIGVEPDRLVPNGPAAVKTGREIAGLMIGALRANGVSGTDEEFAHQIREAASNLPVGSVSPIGDVRAAFDRLLAAGLRLGVATSDFADGTVDELTQLGVLDHVSEIRSGDDHMIKPDPEVLWSIAASWDLPASAIVFVGDSLQDLACARDAGCRFIAVIKEGDTDSELVEQADTWVLAVNEIADVSD